MRFWRKLCFWFRRKRFDEELADEMRLHRHLRAGRLASDGLDPELARREASRQFGNELSLRETSRDIWVMRWLQDGLQDFRFTARTIRRRPAFAIVAVITLALGIGASTAVYSTVHAVLLEPLPYRNPDRVIVIWDRARRDRESQTVASFADYEAYRQSARLIEGVSAAALIHPILTYHGVRRQYLAGVVSAWTFDVLGTPPLFGRAQPMDGEGCSVVLSHTFWTSVLSAEPAVAGKSLEFDGELCTVQAVMPKGFRFYPERTDMWFFLDPSGRKRFRYAAIFARLRPGVTLAQAKSELAAIHTSLHANDEHGKDRAAEADDANRELTYLASSTLRPTLIVLFWAVASLLFVACLSVAGMWMARFIDRYREFVVRAALGCGRGRLVRQALAEGVFLCLGGAGLGVVLAAGAVQMISRKNLTQLPEGIEVSVNTSVLLFAALTTAIAVVLSALVPAWLAVKGDLRFPEIGGRGLSGRPRSLKTSQIMIGGQMAACSVVLAGALLLVDSVLHLETDALGFSTANIVTTRLDLSNYRDPARRIALHDDLIERLRTLPGVSNAAIGSSFPPSRDAGGDTLEVRGRPSINPVFDVSTGAVSAGFFELLGTPVVRGRMFDSRDQQNAQSVAVVSESLVKEYFPDRDPLGQEIRVLGFSGLSPWMTIVGVVGDWKHLEWDARWLASPFVFRPLAQDPTADYAIAVRTQRDLAGMARAISDRILSVDPLIPNEPLQTLDSRLKSMRAYPRFRAFIVTFFALAALGIAAVGLHGTLTEFVSRRTPEFGLRRAIGARTIDLLWIVIRHGGLPVVIGLISSAVAVPALVRIAGSVFVGLRLWNPGIFLFSVFLLLTVVAITIALPARRVANIDPMAALREE